MATVESVRAFLDGRQFSRRTQAALLHLARDPELPLRQVARLHGIDAGRLCHIASEVPGLRELRPSRGGRRAA